MSDIDELQTIHSHVRSLLDRVAVLEVKQKARNDMADTVRALLNRIKSMEDTVEYLREQWRRSEHRADKAEQSVWGASEIERTLHGLFDGQLAMAAGLSSQEQRTCGTCSKWMTWDETKRDDGDGSCMDELAPRGHVTNRKKLPSWCPGWQAMATGGKDIEDGSPWKVVGHDERGNPVYQAVAILDGEDNIDD